MKDNFSQRVDDWNLHHKSRKKTDEEESTTQSPPPKILIEYNQDSDFDNQEEESVTHSEENPSSTIEEDIAKDEQKGFSQKVRTWNRHYRSFRTKGELPQIVRTKQTMDIDSTDLEDDELENYEINITEMVGGWDKHYRPTHYRELTDSRESLASDSLRRTQSMRVKSTAHARDMTEKVCRWEKHFRPNKSKTSKAVSPSEDEKVVQSLPVEKSAKKSAITLLARPEMTGLVDLWNRHFKPQKFRRAQNMEAKQKIKLKPVTSLLVQKWDEHYTKIQQNNERTTLPIPAPIPTEEKQKTSSSLSRTPSLVRARIKDLSSQANRPRIITNESPTRKKEDFAELRSRFVLSC